VLQRQCINIILLNDRNKSSYLYSFILICIINQYFFNLKTKHMKILIIIIYILLCGLSLNAQNVGIGTLTPSTNLEIKKAIKSSVKISSANFSDTSQLIFSNRNLSNEGTDMQISSNRENGLRISSNSDLSANKKDTIMQITPIGNVGIRTAAPQYPLDVKGDMNLTGNLRTNGVAGESGQLLRSNGDGTMSWANKEKYKKFKIFRNDGLVDPTLSTTWTIPAGVTEVAVEIWGGGGKGNTFGGAASGGYIYAEIPTSTYTSLIVTVGAGAGCSICGTSTSGNPSSVWVGNATIAALNAGGGLSSSSVFSQGTFSATGIYLPNISYFGIEGESAKDADQYYENSPAGYFIFLRNGAGADAPLRRGTGGRSGWRRLNWDGTSPVDNTGSNGSEPGGGGGFPGGFGGSGQVIVYW
jgi:hypothetical protein